MFFVKELNPEKYTIEDLSYWISNFNKERVLGFNVIPEGYENTSILVKTEKMNYVLRYSSISIDSPYLVEAEKRLKEEISFINFLKTKGHPVPEIYRTVNGSNQKYLKIQTDDRMIFIILMKRINGYHPKYNYKTLKNIAKILADIHYDSHKFDTYVDLEDLQHSAMGHRLKNLDKKNKNVYNFPLELYQKYKEIYKDLSIEIDEYFKTQKKLMIHNDVKSDNTIFLEGKIKALIDFGDSRVSIVEEDIGCFIWDLCDRMNYKKVKKYLNYFFKIYTKNSKKYKSEINFKIAVNYAIERYLVINLYYLMENQDSEEKLKYQTRKAFRQLKVINRLLKIRELYTQNK